MYLSKLRIFGFKSFANKVEVNFPGDGITAVVGPNGCGKSNIIDAIRWVLGEQRAKALRGAKMEDVIFSGTAERPAMNMAEVTLIVKNDKGVLPSEYSEIMITRRAFRDGSGEYRINNQPCRLRDIQNLFFDTGLGAASYSLMEARMIDSILSDKPEDRRTLFEEAAGISRYRAQRKEAVRQLEKTADDLARVNDSLIHARRNVETFERHAKRAESWRNLHARLRNLELSWKRDLLEEGLKAVAEQERIVERATAEANLLKAEVSAAEAGAAEQRLEASRLESEYREKEREVAEFRAEIQTLESERVRANDAADHFRESLDRLELEAAQIDRTEAQAENVERDHDGDIERARAEVEAAESALSELREEMTTWQRRVEGQRSTLKETASDRMELIERLSRAREELARRENALRSAAEECSRLESEHEVHEARALETEERRKSLENRQERSAESLETAAHEKATLQDELARLSEELESQVDREKAAGQRRAAARSQLDVLRRLEDAMEGVASGPKTLLARADRPQGLRGMLAERLRVPDEHLETVEQCLGESLQWIVADRAEAAAQAVALLSAQEAGTAGFLPLDALRTDLSTRPSISGEGVLGWAADLVACDDEVRPAVDLLLGRTLLVSDRETALTLALEHRGADVWFAAPGLRAHGSGIVFGGRGKKGQAGLLRRHQMLEDFAQALAAAETELADLESRRKGLLERRRELELMVRERETRIAESQRGHAELLAECRRLEAESSGARARLSEIAIRLETLQRLQEESEAASEAARDEVEALNEERAVRERSVARGEEAVREAEESLAAASDRMRAEELRAATARAEIRRLEAAIENAARTRADLSSRRVRVEEQKRDFERQVVERMEQAEIISREVDRKREEFSLLERERGAAKDAYDAAVLAVEQSLGGARGHHQKIAELEKAAHAAQLRREQYNGQIRSLRERAFELYEIDLDEETAKFDRVEYDHENVAQAVEALRAQIKNLGPVNTAALEEYDQEKARLTEIQRHYDDLEKARAGLDKAIKRLDKRAREKFLETFAIVQRNFQDVFSSLFIGGEAKLELEENVDPLEARIEINARPTGKKMRGVTLLSGGERALTATSLLFALYLVRPSPYCILDEVDGPLDDANIGRFVDLLRKFSHQTQFIVVTHNKRTMAASDMLYGVTQEIKGISQLVSVQLDEASRIAA